jgi:hypothetical protein
MASALTAFFVENSGQNTKAGKNAFQYWRVLPAATLFVVTVEMAEYAVVISHYALVAGDWCNSVQIMSSF